MLLAMNKMRRFALPALLAASACQAAADTPPIPFDPSQLAGWWGESYNTDVACGPQNLRSTMQVGVDGKRLEMRFDRKWKTELGETDHFGATIVSATTRTLVIRYDGETRLKRSGKPVEWELAIAGSAMQPNPSIERTSSSVLRTLPAAAHVKR